MRTAEQKGPRCPVCWLAWVREEDPEAGENSRIEADDPDLCAKHAARPVRRKKKAATKRAAKEPGNG